MLAPMFIGAMQPVLRSAMKSEQPNTERTEAEHEGLTFWGP